MSVRIVLVEDHDLVRAGFRSLLEPVPDVTVVAEASSGSTGVGVVLEHRPDIVLLDIVLPGLNGFEVLARIQDEAPECRVIVLSMYRDEEYAARAFRGGAAGYLSKDVDVQELAEALRLVHRGGRYLASALSWDAVRSAMARKQPDKLAALTPRQREVLQLVAEGYTTREIAERLAISPKTVEAHRAHVMDRLDIHDLAGLVRFAVAVGIVSAR